MTEKKPLKFTKSKKVTDQTCSEVRWLYKKSGESKWTPFGDYDSMSMELAYRKRRKIDIDEKAKQIVDNFPKTDRILLFDNYYEWDPKANPDIVTNVYWKDDEIKVTRGTWFFIDSMQPLEPEVAEKIERHHLRKFRGQYTPDITEPALTTPLTTCFLDKYGEVYWYSFAHVSFHASAKKKNLISIFTRSTNDYPLQRGFTLEEEIDVHSEFSDLILVVHGVGQKGYENLIARNTSQLREAVDPLMKAHFPNEKRRPMILPIEWRSSLVLDQGITDTITLPKLSNIRNLLNSAALDIMYYQSPLYRQEIINGIITCLNAAYAKFIESHPNFKGAVSIFAHSLGSVISYDIVTKWSPLVFYDEFVTQEIEKQRDTTDDEDLKKMYDNFYQSRTKLMEKGSQLRNTLSNMNKGLSFKVKFLFCVGSPLAVYIVMRGHSGSFLPAPEQCERIINIFHPHDPVAYRLEPLFDESYKSVKPVKIFSYSECDKSYEDLEPELRKSCSTKLGEVKKKDEDLSDSQSDSECSPPRARSPLKSNGELNESDELPELTKSQELPVIENTKSPIESLLENIPEKNRMPGRFDYAIRPKFGERTISYWALMKSHFSYWSNQDVVGFVLNQLYPKPVEPKQEQKSERDDRKG